MATESGPSKKPKRVKRQILNQRIRHDWMVGWFISLVNIDILEEEYYTPGSPDGLIMFVQFLMDKAKQSIDNHTNNVGKDDDALREMCKQSALNWKREWISWKNSQEKIQWMASNEGEFLWNKLTTTNPFFEAKREEFAGEVERWFNIGRGSIGRVYIEKDKHYMLDEPITEPSLTCVSQHDLYSTWDDKSRIHSNPQHDYHLVRFSPKNLTQFYGASMVYVAKKFKHIEAYEKEIMAQHRMFLEIQSSGIRMAGLVNPVAMVNNEDSPMLIFPHWNGGTLHDMVQKMMVFQEEVQKGIPVVADEKLHLFLQKRLEIALVLLETLWCMHSKGWLHNNLHAKNILLHFPAWKWTKQGEPKMIGSRDLVFVGISNFGRACKIKHADAEWTPKWQDWDWEAKSFGPPQHIAPELYQTSDTNRSHWNGLRVFTEFTDMYALGTTIKKMCTDYFVGWESLQYIQWHDRLNHTKEFREKIGVSSRLAHLLHRMVHADIHLRKTAKINTHQWKQDLGVSSQGVYRPLFGWSI